LIRLSVFEERPTYQGKHAVAETGLVTEFNPRFATWLTASECHLRTKQRQTALHRKKDDLPDAASMFINQHAYRADRARNRRYLSEIR
jgi:hypothetical protein